MLSKNYFAYTWILEIISNMDYFQCFIYHITEWKHLFIEVGINYPTLGFTVLQENFLFLGGQVI